MTNELSEFVRTSFDSVWALELMLFLQEQSASVWTADDLVVQLRGSPLMVDRCIVTLIAAGCIVREASGQVRYHAASERIDRLARATADAYRRKPDQVRRTIVTAAAAKFQTLADAFKLKRD